MPDAQVAQAAPPLLSLAGTHRLEVDLVALVYRQVERLLDNQPGIPESERRALERLAKLRCAGILKRAACEVAEAVNKGRAPEV